MVGFVPTTADIFSVRASLASRRLPNELILNILDYARYWVEVTTEIDTYEALMDGEFSLDFSATILYSQIFPYQRFDYIQGDERKIREIEFLIVSHDQGWTTEDTAGTFKTSSWFEVSILPVPGDAFRTRQTWPEPETRLVCKNIYEAKQVYFSDVTCSLRQRPSLELEPHRTHCPEMMQVTEQSNSPSTTHRLSDQLEGLHSWFLQGNEVARGKSLFEGDIIRRYRVIWGSAQNPNWDGNDGSGKGEGFVDSIQRNDLICVWARAKRRGWENHIHGMRVIIRYNI